MQSKRDQYIQDTVRATKTIQVSYYVHSIVYFVLNVKKIVRFLSFLHFIKFFFFYLIRIFVCVYIFEVVKLIFFFIFIIPMSTLYFIRFISIFLQLLCF